MKLSEIYTTLEASFKAANMEADVRFGYVYEIQKRAIPIYPVIIIEPITNSIVPIIGPKANVDTQRISIWVGFKDDIEGAPDPYSAGNTVSRFEKYDAAQSLTFTAFKYLQSALEGQGRTTGYVFTPKQSFGLNGLVGGQAIITIINPMVTC